MFCCAKSNSERTRHEFPYRFRAIADKGKGPLAPPLSRSQGEREMPARVGVILLAKRKNDGQGCPSNPQARMPALRPGMSVAMVTGSAGLIGSETCKRFHAEGFEVIGI